jgi:hypothetical protein
VSGMEKKKGTENHFTCDMCTTLKTSVFNKRIEEDKKKNECESDKQVCIVKQISINLRQIKK